MIDTAGIQAPYHYTLNFRVPAAPRIAIGISKLLREQALEAGLNVIQNPMTHSTLGAGTYAQLCIAFKSNRPFVETVREISRFISARGYPIAEVTVSSTGSLAEIIHP